MARGRKPKQANGGGANLGIEPVIVVPAYSVRKNTDTTLGPIFNKVAQNKIEARTLAAIRDALLPKLRSDEIRVEETEATVGKATP
jgi:type I restriction enzyme S subunit